MSVLIVADTKNGEVKKSSLEAVFYGSKVAAALGGEAVALTLNANDASSLGNYGASKVLNVTDSSISASDPQKVVAAIVAAANSIGAKVVVFGDQRDLASRHRQRFRGEQERVQRKGPRAGEHPER